MTHSSRRIFLGIPVSEPLKDEIENVIRKLSLETTCLKTAWVRRSNLHITLQFFGQITEVKLSEISKRLRSVVYETQPFEIEFNGIGVFPNGYRPRVIWIGINDFAKNINLLETKINNVLMLEREADGEYIPHLTVGRVKEGKMNLSLVLRSFQQKHFGKMSVTKIVLYESITRSSGPNYYELESFQFSS